VRRPSDDERDGRRLLTASVARTSLVACGGGADDPTTPSNVVEVDGTFPTIELERIDGGTFVTADLGGRPAVVNLWATWCDPCEREQPMLVAAHEDLGDEVAFLGVDYRDQPDAALEWLEEYGVPYANVADPNGQLATRLGVTTGLPTTVIVDARGRLRFRVLGELERATLDELLGRLGVATG
jgi:cytochrome c biogenesis protein CcmG, thiol:disulfide interchange protein DsbE